jgi:hypothetical protein
VNRLNRLNGWQRLWFVLAALSVAYAVIIAPFPQCDGMHQYSFVHRRGLERDIQNPLCRTYQTAEFSQLKNPGYDDGGSCWHLYTSRLADRTNAMPYTLQVYDKDTSRQHTDCLIEASFFFGLAALIGSALIYGFGAILAWIRRGFATRPF